MKADKSGYFAFLYPVINNRCAIPVQCDVYQGRGNNDERTTESR